MITSSGVFCDVCGKYILPIDPEERINPFRVEGIVQMLHCDNKCKALVLAATDDWHKLPNGPLRKAFEVAHKEGGQDEQSNANA